MAPLVLITDFLQTPSRPRNTAAATRVAIPVAFYPSGVLLQWIPLLFLVVITALASQLFAQGVIDIPASDLPQHVAIALPEGELLDTKVQWQLVNVDDPTDRLPIQLSPARAKDGTPSESQQQVLATIPPTGTDKKIREFRLEKSADGAPANHVFRFVEQGEPSLQLLERDKPILTYNFGTVTDETLPKSEPRRSRACYIHPIWGMGGEILTGDFPKDHAHHHGVFWAWPYVKTGGTTYDLWMYSDIQQRFVRWLHREVGSVAAQIGVENGWFVGDRKVVTERVWISVYRSEQNARVIDLSITLIANDQQVTIQGRQLKSYGGLTLRYDVLPRTDATVRVPDRTLDEDLLNTPLAWADLASRFPNSEQRSGASVFIHPNHPDYPPAWLTRRYGALCVGWPGIKPHTLDPGKPITLDYRLWVHGSEETPETIGQVYASYCKSRR